MRIQELTLKNFRGFEDLTVTFPEGKGGLAVFVGLNGSGKTSVLEAVKSNLLGFFVQVNSFCNRRKKNFGYFLPKETNPEFDVFNIRDYPNNKGFEIEASYSRDNLFVNYYSIVTEPFDSSSWQSHRGFSKKTSFELFIENYLKDPLLTVGYYSVNRKAKKHVKWFDPELESRPDIKFRKNDYSDAFDSQTDFELFFHWFKYREDLENEVRAHENSEFRDKELSFVRGALSEFNLDFHKPRILRSSKIRLVFEKKGQTLSIEHLSDGEKIIFSMVSDIARRMVIRNPSLENPLHGKGIVLIDEIELHLHPEWQRKIIPALRRTFPNVQFIITTHSPQVISTVKKENVFILKDFQLQNTPHTQGRDSNSILQEIFGVEKRPPEFQKEFDKLYRMMDDPESVDLTKHMLNDVEEKYGFYDQEVIRARSFFEDLNNK